MFYVVVYTLGLKRRTTQNIVIGGAAGAFPPLVGWAVATGALAPLAWWMFVVVFLWTPPHFWALALIRRQEYARAQVPMLPVIVGEKTTQVYILIYSLVLVTVSLLPVAFSALGLLYGIAALALGVLLVYWAWRLLSIGATPVAWQLYKYSLLYLALLFVSMVIDRLLLG